MRRLVEALDRLSINSSALDFISSPGEFSPITHEDSHFRLHIQTPSISSSTSSLGPVTPLDEKNVSWSFEHPTPAPKTSNSARFHVDTVYEPVDRKRAVVDRTHSGGAKSSPRYI